MTPQVCALCRVKGPQVSPTSADLLLAAECCEETRGTAEAGRLWAVAAWLRRQAWLRVRSEFVQQTMDEKGISRNSALALFRVRHVPEPKK